MKSKTRYPFLEMCESLDLLKLKDSDLNSTIGFSDIQNKCTL